MTSCVPLLNPKLVIPIEDPYEEPKNPSLKIDTTDITEEEAIQDVMLYLEKEGFLC